MGLDVVIACKRCRVAGPLMDGGFMGQLSLSTLPITGSRGPQNFGLIFAGYAAIGGVTYEWQQLHDFLQAHEKHNLVRLVNDEIGEAEWLEGEDFGRGGPFWGNEAWRSQGS